MPTLHKYDWIFALITIFFCCSAFGNGANDVANSYATSVAARTLTMVQVGFLAACTEFIGAVALGSRVTKTIKSGIIDITRFNGKPGALMLVMSCTEFGSACWLFIATRIGFPVSTTQTVIGALVGAGFASQTHVQWGWKSGSISQTAASWGIAPCISAGFAAVIYLTIKYLVLERSDPLAWGMRLIPFYLALTGAILALFIVIEAPNAPSLEKFGAGKAVGIILGVFFGCLLVAIVFFMPYFHRRLVRKDARLRAYHVVLGPLLLREDAPLFLPGNPKEGYIRDYYAKDTVPELNKTASAETEASTPGPSPDIKPISSDPEKATTHTIPTRHIPQTPEERYLGPTAKLPMTNPRRLWAYVKYFVMRGISQDCVTYNEDQLAELHSRAKVYSSDVEHLWTYPQMASAMMMSIAHGSNDVSNAVGPWSATYMTWRTSTVSKESDVPVWMLVVAGLLIGIGFWFYGYHIIRQLGNKLTQMSPTRGFSMELGAAITVLMASRLSLPVSTTQCLTGAAVGVALMNFDARALNWKATVWIFLGWILTLPCAGLISGLLTLMALNTPHL